MTQTVQFMASGDLHLFDREIGATKGYAEESSRNLTNLTKRFEGTNSLFMILGGDVQHGIPEDIRVMSDWRVRLAEMRDMVYTRLEKSGLLDTMKVYDADDNLMDIKSRKHSCLFSVKGNHDYNRRADRNDSFTFYDDLVDSRIISSPSKIVINQTEIHFYHNGEYNQPKTPASDTKAVIGVYHDAIVKDGVVMDVHLGTSITPEKSKMFEHIDLAIVNDIHLQIKPYKVTTTKDDGTTMETDVVTHGSIGRTSYSPSHQRDNALLTQVTISEDDFIEYELIELALKPYMDLFDYESVIKVKKRENMFSHLSLEVEKLNLVKKDPREDVAIMDIEPSIKQKCLDLLDKAIGDK